MDRASAYGTSLFLTQVQYRQHSNAFLKGIRWRKEMKTAMINCVYIIHLHAENFEVLFMPALGEDSIIVSMVWVKLRY